jgi:two-component SAPR family response regulator
MEKRLPRVGIMNSNTELIELIEIILKDAGYITAGIHLLKVKENLELYSEFLKKYNPDVWIIDIPIPYDVNYYFVKNLIARKESRGRAFVLTSTNKSKLDELVGPTNTLELVGKPFDMSELVDAVEKAYQIVLGKKIHRTGIEVPAENP